MDVLRFQLGIWGFQMDIWFFRLSFRCSRVFFFNKIGILRFQLGI